MPDTLYKHCTTRLFNFPVDSAGWTSPSHKSHGWWVTVQAALHVDANQIRMAKGIWRQTCQELADIQAERQDILERIEQQDSRPLAWLSHASVKTAAALQLLEQVSELKQNALLQHEVLRQASQLVVWQICSPDTAARVMHYSRPAFPNILGVLKAMAAMSVA